MNILVLLKMVPDVVEELEVAAGGTSLNGEYLRMIVSESDDHALEEALLLKERYGGKVTVLALDAPEVDDALFNALAKGADRVLKIVGAEGGTGATVTARSRERGDAGRRLVDAGGPDPLGNAGHRRSRRSGHPAAFASPRHAVRRHRDERGRRRVRQQRHGHPGVPEQCTGRV